MGKNSKDQTPSTHVSDFEKGRTEPQTAFAKTGFLHKSFFHACLIVAIGFIVYSNTFRVPFILDDLRNIVDNYKIRDISNIPYFFSNVSGPPIAARPLTSATFALNYYLGGLNTSGYHIVNLLIHIINALLLYALVLLTFRTPSFSKSIQSNNPPSPPFFKGGQGGIFIALFSSLLFVSHPIQTQAVTYIVQRFTSLAALFCLLSLVLYIKARQGNQKSEDRRQNIDMSQKRGRLKSVLFYPASVLSAVLAMKTKEIAFTLPVMIALYEFLFFEGKVKRRVLYLVPFLLTMLIIPLTLLGTDKPIGELISDVSEATRIQTAMSRWDYLFTQFRVILTYIRLLFVPINQNLDYDYPVYHSFFDLPVFLSFLFLSLLFILAVYLLRLSYQPPTPNPKSPSSSPSTIHHSPFTSRSLGLISFGIFWFFITLSVESSVIPITDVIFEHRVYLPSVGAFIALGTSVFLFAESFKHRWPWLGKALMSALVCAVIIFSGITYARNTVWQDGANLWEDVVEKSPKKARGHDNLGNAFYRKGRIDEAIKEYRIALSLKPDFAGAHFNLGVAFRRKGLPDEAIQEYRIALTLKPDFAEAHNSLGNAYRSKGWVDGAIEEYLIALSLKPDFAEAHFNLGITYARRGLKGEAAEELIRALRIDPDLQEARQALESIME